MGREVMKKINVRLPDYLAADIEAESRRRGISKAEVCRQRLQSSPWPVVEPSRKPKLSG